MRLDYVKLTNYAGLKRGSNINILEIDFTKQKYGICFIIAKNKGGKTTLLKALHPLPDGNYNFLEKEYGEKLLVYRDNDGIRLQLIISHPINSKGERSTTKASFKKEINGEYIELNPNGNIGSYKELIEAYFGLDANFLALSMLSTDDKGIVTKTPSERKKYVTAILENLEVYNNIGKVMTKRVSTLRAMINSITAKIESIGNREILQTNLSFYNKKISTLEENKIIAIKNQSKYEAIIDTIDPDKTITDKYNSIVKSLNTIKAEIKYAEDIIFKVGFENDKSAIRDKIINSIEDLNNKKILIEKEMYSLDTIIPRLLAEHEEDARSIELKNNRFNSLQSEQNYTDISNKISILRNTISEYENEFNRIGITDPLNISKDEYIIALNCISEIRSSLDSLRSGSITRDVILIALSKVMCNDNVYLEIRDISDKILNMKNQLSLLQIEIIDYQNKLDKLSILDNRPSNCKINTCSFISDVLDIQKQNPEKSLIDTSIQIDRLEKEISDNNENLLFLNEVSEYMEYLNIIKRDIDSNKSILLKLPHGEKFININYLVDASLNGEDFKIMDDVYKSITNANIFDLYRECKLNLYKLESDFKLYESKSSIIDGLITEINTLKSKTDKTLIKLDELTNDKKELYTKSEFISNDIEKYNLVLQSIDNLYKKYDICKELELEMKEIAIDSEKIKNLIFSINEIIRLIKSIDNELIPLLKQRDDTIYSLKILDQYDAELKKYSDKYIRSNILKKHSIPNTGIQKIFMKMYMHNVIRMSNEILEYFFDGDIVLTKYNISDTEFTLPCYDKPSGITNSDISLCSGSEKCMLGMIISYSLLKQSASDYDILRLDEIDSELDQNNRLILMPALNKLRDILGVKQIIMISHSPEIELENADIIKLSQATRYTGSISGNIIYDSYN